MVTLPSPNITNVAPESDAVHASRMPVAGPVGSRFTTRSPAGLTFRAPCSPARRASDTSVSVTLAVAPGSMDASQPPGPFGCAQFSSRHSNGGVLSHDATWNATRCAGHGGGGTVSVHVTQMSETGSVYGPSGSGGSTICPDHAPGPWSHMAQCSS